MVPNAPEYRELASTPSHFICQNIHGRIVIIELPGDNPAKATLYTGPLLTGSDADRVPPTLSFQLDNQTGREDMVLHVGEQTYLYLNTGSTLTPSPPGAA